MELIQPRPIDQALTVLRRRHRLSLAFGVATALIALALGFTTVPLYEARSLLVVERDRKTVSLASDQDRGSGDDAFSILNTHCDLISSPAVLSAAAGATRLELSSPYATARDAGELLGKRLRALPQRDSWIIDLALRDEDPQRATRVLQAIIDAYLAAEARRRADVAEASLAFLRAQVERARLSLDGARSREQDLRREKGVIGLDPNANHLTAELSNLNLTRVRLAAERAAGDALGRTIAEADGVADRGERLGALVRIPEIRREVVVQQALQGRSELYEKRAALSQVYKERHPRMVEIEAQVAAAETRLEDAVASTRQGLIDAGLGIHRQATEIDARIADIERQVAGYREVLSSLKTRSDEVATAEKLHEQLLNRLNEEEVNGRLSAPRVSIAQPPHAGLDPVNFRRGLFILGALASGLGMAVAAAFLAELLERRARDPRTMSELTGLPLLAELGKAQAMVPAVQPGSALNEGIRALRTGLQLAVETGRSPGVVAIVSAAPGDGRTTIACRLAIALAGSGRRVLLVDGDLHNPGVPWQLGLAPAQRGLTDLLGGATDVGPLASPVERLDVVLAGTPAENAAELLHGARLAEAMQAWRTLYEVVIVDTATLPSAEALEIVDVADHALLVVRDGHTPRASLRTALERLQRMRGKLTGVVVNG